MSKEDFIELIRQSEEWEVEPTHSTLVEMARRKKIRNHSVLTKYELKKALDFLSENKPRSRSYIFSNSPEAHFEFTTRKDAMDGMNCSAKKIANGIKNGKILIKIMLNINLKGNNFFQKFKNLFFKNFIFEKILLFLFFK